MSKYTTELRYICEQKAGLDDSKGYNSIAETIEAARPQIFSFDYPIFDNTYKPVLETKILKHYYTREIGEETFGLWQLRLDTRLNEIMPYYNQMYNSELLEFNPLYDVDLTTNRSANTNRTDNEAENGSFSETGSRDVASTISENKTRDVSETISETIAHDVTVNTDIVDNTTQNTTNAENADDWNEYSDTPQGGLSGIENHTYLTNATHDTHAGTSTQGVSVANTVDNDVVTDEDTTRSLASTIDEDNTLSNASNVDEDTSRSGSNTKQRALTLTNTEQYIEHVTGKRGGASFAGMLMEFRQTFLNIDMMIINELSDLFMNLW